MKKPRKCEANTHTIAHEGTFAKGVTWEGRKSRNIASTGDRRQYNGKCRIPERDYPTGQVRTRIELNSSLIESWGSDTEQTQAQRGPEPYEN